MADPDITLSFVPDPINPLGQLEFSVKNGIFFVGDRDSVTVGLDNIANFVSIIPISPQTPDNSKIEITFAEDLKLATITVLKDPTHYLSPWALAFNVNVGGITKEVAMASPTLWLFRGSGAQGSMTVTLNYNSDSGSFTLDSALELASLQLLVNPNLPFVLTFNLESNLDDPNNPNSPRVKFNSANSIVFIGAREGIDNPLISNDGRTASISIGEDPGELVSFRFAVDVPDSNNTTITATSPDPIIINATIGDG